MNLSVLLPYISIAIVIATFFIGRLASSRTAGKETGSLETDVEYIKNSIERIERRFAEDINRLEDRANEISAQISSLAGLASVADSAANCVQQRLDEHLTREHDMHTGMRK